MTELSSTPTLEKFRLDAREWLQSQLPLRKPVEQGWGVGDDNVAIFQNLSFEEERDHIHASLDWQRTKYDAGYGALTWPTSAGGRGLPMVYEQAFREEEAAFAVPDGHEAVGITLDLVGPTIMTCGTEEQRARFLAPLRRGDELWCQLFSEPEAGSDLASLRTRAERVDGGWRITGQKVWTSGAQFADYGYLLARTDPTARKHAGITAFIVPMRGPGVEVRPLRQITGGTSFNEVFFDGLVIGDDFRISEEGKGWAVALTTLGFERSASSSGATEGLFERVRDLARVLKASDDPIHRQRLVGLYTDAVLLRVTHQRTISRIRAGAAPGPEGSITKLFWTESLRHTSDAVTELLGPRLVADTGEWGTYAWSEFVIGAGGYRIAGGSDEIQRSIIAERVLGLPREPSAAQAAL